jgi:hypothetical protein
LAVDERELAAAGLPAEMFFNLNAPEDLAALRREEKPRRMWRRKKGRRGAVVKFRQKKYREVVSMHNTVVVFTKVPKAGETRRG